MTSMERMVLRLSGLISTIPDVPTSMSPMIRRQPFSIGTKGTEDFQKLVWNPEPRSGKTDTNRPTWAWPSEITPTRGSHRYLSQILPSTMHLCIETGASGISKMRPTLLESDCHRCLGSSGEMHL